MAATTQKIYAFLRGGGNQTEPNTPSWVNVSSSHNQPPPDLTSMMVSVFELENWRPAQFPSMWVSVF